MLPVPGSWELLGLSIEEGGPGEIVLRMDVSDALLSPFGKVQGGFVAALFDVGLAIAVARSVAPEDRIATHNLNVTYLTFTADRVLRCHARVLRLARTIATAEGEVRTPDGTMVAKAVGTFGVRRASATPPAAE